jgi:hypothetical protein
MVLLLIAILLGLAGLIWLWKVPFQKIVRAMKKGGSSPFEAYTIIFLLMAAAGVAIYMIVKVI